MLITWGSGSDVDFDLVPMVGAWNFNSSKLPGGWACLFLLVLVCSITCLILLIYRPILSCKDFRAMIPKLDYMTKSSMELQKLPMPGPHLQRLQFN